MTAEESDSDGWKWCTAEGAELHTLLLGLETTLAEKLQWLEEAEDLSLRLRAARESSGNTGNSERRSLAETLGMTRHCSPLLRKARGLGVSSIEDAIALAVERGCHHYRPAISTEAPAVSRSQLSDAELVVLLLLGEQAYTPLAIRAAAQLARSPELSADRLADLARRERSQRVLAHIARAGRDHDPEGRAFWSALLDALGPLPETPEPALPHWSRFVSAPGIQRNGRTPPPTWLVPST